MFSQREYELARENKLEMEITLCADKCPGLTNGQVFWGRLISAHILQRP